MSLVKVTSKERNGVEFIKKLLIDTARVSEPIIENLSGEAIVEINETPKLQNTVNQGNNNVQYVLNESVADFVSAAGTSMFAGTVVTREGRAPSVANFGFVAERVVGRITEHPSGSVFLYEEEGGLLPIEYVVSESINELTASLVSGEIVPPTVTYVDANTGDDLTGERGNPNAKFATIGAAQNVVIGGDKIDIAGGFYPGESNLGKDNITYDFANGAVVEVAAGQTLWNDTVRGYKVKGFAVFQTAEATPSSILINLFQGTSETRFEFKSITAECTYAVVNCSNSGYGRSIRGEFINNTYSGTTGRGMRFSGGGVKDVDINLIYAHCNVEGTTYFGSTGENGNVFTFGGNSYTIYLKCGDITNTNANNVAPIMFSRTGVAGTLHFNGNINAEYPVNTWLSAGLQHQGGRIWYEGEINITNGSAYTGSNFGATHLFRHIGGRFNSINNSAVVLQGTGPSGDQLSWVFDGAYESVNPELQATCVLGHSLWEGQVFFGMTERFSIKQGTPGKSAIRFVDAYGGANLTFGNGFVYMQDPADLIIEGAGTPQFDVQGIVSSNASGIYAGATIVPAGAIVSDVNFKDSPLPTDVTTRWTVVQW